MSSHFPLPKIRTFRVSLHTSYLFFLKWSPLSCWNSQWVHTFRCQKKSSSLFRLSLEWREPRDEWSKTQDKWSNSAQSIVLPFEKMNQINTKNYIGSAEALPILCVRCVRWGREREGGGERERESEWERYREREIDGSDVTLVAQKLAKKFALFLAKTLKLAKNFAPQFLSFSPRK